MPKNHNQPVINLSPKINDEIKKTTCYMCACRCGINVHLQDDKVRFIEGNRDHPINQGVLCAKGSAGIMQHESPARLKSPMLRVGKRGEGKFKPISWEEALTLACDWLKPVREQDPKQLAFFTGRDQSQSLTSWWAQQFGTPNYAAHGGFCSVNMAAAGIYTMGGSFWEFGQTDWEHTKYFMLFGVAEDHDSNPIKMGLSKLKGRGSKIVSVNPVRTGYNAIADEWLGITPGTDGLFILSLIHLLLKEGKVDLDYLLRYSNASWLVIEDKQEDGTSNEHDGLFARDEEGNPLAFDRKAGKLGAAKMIRQNAALRGSYLLENGKKARPVFEIMAELYAKEEYSPEATAKETGILAEQTIRIASEIAQIAFNQTITLDQPWTDLYGETHATMVGRPISFHAMRGISAHSNGFQTCRALHLLQILLGTIDCPGGFRFKPPYPKPSHAHPLPHGESNANAPLAGPHLGYPQSPADLLIDDQNNPLRIDKAFSWENPLSAHGLMHMVIANAYHHDPYKIEVLFLYMANMAWNSSMNSFETMKMLAATDENGDYKIPKIIYSDAYSSEMVAFADLILPDTTYLERHDCISLLDRPISEPNMAADSIRWPVVNPDRDPNRQVRVFQTVLLDLGARLGLNGMVDKSGNALYKDYADYMVNHQRKNGIGPLAGYRGKDEDQFGRGEPNPNQIARYIENGGFATQEIPENARYFKHANADYQNWAVKMGFFDQPQVNIFQLYLEPLAKFRLAASGFGKHQPPDALRARILKCFSPLPDYYPPFEGNLIQESMQKDQFPLHAITQRPAAMYHSWGSQNAWLRQIHGHNPLFVSGALCDEMDLKTGDFVYVISHHGKIKVPVARNDALNRNTVWTWNAIGKRQGAWALHENSEESQKGFLLNSLIHELLPFQKDGMRWANADPITGQAAWYDLRVRIEKIPADEIKEIAPKIPAQISPVGIGESMLTYGKKWTDQAKKNKSKVPS